MLTTPATARPALSLIFVNFQSARYLSGALRSLYAAEDLGPVEIIVVNNDPREAPLLGFLERSYGFRLIQNAENQGFAAAVNQGAALASGDVLGLLNPDIAWPGERLGRVQAFFAEHPEAFLGLSLRDARGRSERFGYGRRPVTLWRLFVNHLPRPRAHQGPGCFTVAWLSGGALFLPRALFLKLGGMDEDFFLYYEDVDLCERARLQGIALWVCPAWWITHLGGMSDIAWGSRKAHYQSSQARFFRLHRPAYEGFLLDGLRRLFGTRPI